MQLLRLDPSVVCAGAELSELWEDYLFTGRVAAVYVLRHTTAVERRSTKHDPGAASRTGARKDAGTQ